MVVLCKIGISDEFQRKLPSYPIVGKIAGSVIKGITIGAEAGSWAMRELSVPILSTTALRVVNSEGIVFPVGGTAPCTVNTGIESGFDREMENV